MAAVVPDAAPQRKDRQRRLEHRVEWNSHDDFGVIVSELNRIAVRLRDLRDSEAGRKQMTAFHGNAFLFRVGFLCTNASLSGPISN